MLIKFFKKSENQSETSISIKDTEISQIVVGNSVKQLTSTITTSNRKFYKATNEKMKESGEGSYFAIDLSGKYLFAFVRSDWKVATVIHKVGKSYIEQSFEMTRRTDKTWIFEVDTIDSVQVSKEQKQIIVSEIDINKLEELSKEEMMEIIIAQHKALKKVNEEVKESKEIIEAKEEEIETISKKSSKHFAQKTTYKSVADFYKKKVNSIMAIAHAGGDVASMIRVDAQMNFITENKLNAMEYFDALDEIEGM